MPAWTASSGLTFTVGQPTASSLRVHEPLPEGRIAEARSQPLQPSVGASSRYAGTDSVAVVVGSSLIWRASQRRRCDRIRVLRQCKAGTAVLTEPVVTTTIISADVASEDEVTVDQTPALLIISLCFLVSVICALDRAAMSVAIIPMSSEFGYSDGDKGLVASAYFWGYVVSNFLSGVAGSTVSPKNVLSVGVVLWSFFTVLTPVAASSSLPMLLACRALMGLAEGACLPCIQQLLANWIPQAERSRAIAFVTTGLTVGTVGSLYLAPAIVASLGWQSVFYIFGLSGLLWCFAWSACAEDAPQSPKQCVPYECEINWNDTSGPAATATKPFSWQETFANVPLRQMIGSTQFRGCVSVGIAHNIGQLVILSWLPTYFADTYGRNIGDASALAAPPWICCFLVGNLAGWAADALIKNDVPVKDVRKGFQLLGSLGPAVCLLLLILSQHTEQEALILFSAALGLSGCSYIGFNACPADMSSKNTAVVYGTLNAIGCLAGAFAVWLTGLALQAYSGAGYTAVFGTAVVLYVVGVSIFCLLYEGEREFE